MTYPTNTFKSEVFRSISSNALAPQAITIDVPVGGYALILGLTIANKSTTPRYINLTLKKSGAVESGFILYNVALPSETSFQAIDGDKMVIERGDVLEAWGDVESDGSLDLVVSYVVYAPPGAIV